MRYVIILILGLVANIASAQQVNPVPDYTFSNRMSAGRNTVTDTAAYFSIGPRYGAVRGMMPPMVVDTASVSGNKRNGLLIFSVQKNKFVYWDSVGSKWAEMAGTGGTAISSGDTASMLLPYLRKADTTAMLTKYLRRSDTATLSNRINLKVNISDTASMLAPYLKESDTVFLSNRVNLKVNISDTSSMLTNYIRHAGNGLTKSGQALSVDTASIATRARVQKGIDSVAVAGLTGSGTTNYVAKFTGTKALGNSLIQDNGLNVGVNTTPTTTKFTVSESANSWAAAFIAPSSNEVQISGNITGNNNGPSIRGVTSGGVAYTSLTLDASYLDFKISGVSQQRIFSNGNIGIGTTTDAGYKTDIAGTLRSTLGANFATTSGNVGIGTASPAEKLHISRSDAGDIAMLASNSVSSNYFITRASGNAEILTTSGAIQFSTNGGEDMRISTSGELLINTTTDAGDYKLQVAGSIYNTTGAVLAASSGNVGIGTASPTGKFHVSGGDANFTGASGTGVSINLQPNTTNADARTWGMVSTHWEFGDFSINQSDAKDGNPRTAGTSRLYINKSGEVLINTITDAGDYKLQINGNERIAGKLDVITTTEYGVNLGRSGTSATGFQAYNSTAAMAVGIESSAGGGLFTGTSAYAAVFGNANNYPTQFVTNNTLRATISAAGELLVGTTFDQGAYALQVNGSVYNTGQVTRGAFNLIGTGAQFSTDSTTNLSPVYLAGQSLTGSSAQGLIYGNATWNTSGTPSLIDINLTNTSSSSDANYIKITDGTNTFRVTKSAEVVTAAPTGGSIRKWKLGEAATVSPTSPNRTIRVEIDGTVYYLHAKTTND